MSLNLLGSRYFWAVFLIFIGLLLVAGQLLDFAVPLFRVVVTTILVTAGIQLVLKASSVQDSPQSRAHQHAVLLGAGDRHVTAENIGSHYYTVLGSQILVLRGLSLSQSLSIEVNTLLGEVHLYLPRFSNIRIRNTTFLGKSNGAKHANEAQLSEQPVLTVDAHTVLGSLTVYRSA